MVTFTLGHTAIDLAVEAPGEDLAWLSDFVDPAFRARPAGHGDRPVVRFDPAGRRPFTPGHAGRSRVAFAFDKGPVLMAETSDDTVTYLVNDRTGVTFALHDSPPRVVVSSGTSRASGRIALMRVVREFAHNAVIDSGGLVLHAAAATLPHGAALLVGPKGAGKTTMLARLLGLAGVEYLSNDRVAIPHDSARVYPMPTIVGVREGTRTLLPSLTAALAPLPAFTADDASEPERRTAAGTWYFSPRQFAGALSCDLAPGAAIAAVVRLSGFGPLASRQLDGADAVDVVRAAVLGQHSGHVRSDVFRVGGQGIDACASIDAGCVRLASRVPVFAVTVPPDPEPAAFEDMVQSWR